MSRRGRWRFSSFRQWRLNGCTTFISRNGDWRPISTANETLERANLNSRRR
jgi:hypothetical protein